MKQFVNTVAGALALCAGQGAAANCPVIPGRPRPTTAAASALPAQEGDTVDRLDLFDETDENLMIDFWAVAFQIDVRSALSSRRGSSGSKIR